jgi:hypothetical protein
VPEVEDKPRRITWSAIAWGNRWWVSLKKPIFQRYLIYIAFNGMNVYYECLNGQPKFDSKGECHLKDKNGDDVILLKKTWNLKLTYPERAWIAHNFDLIKGTIANPTKVRPSSQNVNSEVLYKECARICIGPGITVPSVCKYFAVVLESKNNKKIIKTFYPTNRIKK